MSDVWARFVRVRCGGSGRETGGGGSDFEDIVWVVNDEFLREKMVWDTVLQERSRMRERWKRPWGRVSAWMERICTSLSDGIVDQEIRISRYE